MHGFFDGTAQNNTCGAGVLLVINEDHKFKMRMNCGFGSNTKAELLALWSLVNFAATAGIDSFQSLSTG